jgi:hypothetical protein
MSFSSDQATLVNQLPISVDFPREQEKFLEALTLLYKRIANCVNTKEGGLFSIQELFNSQQYFTPGIPNIFRNVYRTTFDMIALNGGPIAPGATVSQPHNIVGITAPTHIYGGAVNSDSPVKFLPLNYVSATTLTDQIQIYLDPTNVILINGSTQSTLTSATIVAEYLKT